MNQAISKNTQAVKYWLKKLRAYTACSFYTAKEESNPYDRIQLNIPFQAELSSQLINLAKNKDFNIYKLSLTALGILLGKYTNRPDLPLTTTAIGVGKDFNDNTALIFPQLPFDQEDTVRAFLKKIHVELESSITYQNYDYHAFAEEFILESNLIGNIFNLAFGYDQVNRFNDDLEKSEIVFWLTREDNEFTLNLSSQRAVYNEVALELLANQYLSTLNLIVGNIDLKISELNFITDLDHQLFTKFNATEKDFIDTPVIEQFEAQAALRPDAVCLKSGQTILTYAEVNERGNQVARYLIDQCQLEAGEKVSLMVHRSEHIIIGIVGILKAKGMYIPIDLSSPQERIQFFLEDSGSRIILSEKAVITDFASQENIQIVAIDDLSNDPIGNLEAKPAKRDLAYMIYTSGTTGKPKGAMVFHDSLANHVSWFRRQFELTEKDSTMLINSYSFDGCYSYIWATLTSGGTLHIPRDKYFDPEKTIKYIAKEKVSFLKLVPSTFGVLVNSAAFEKYPEACQSIRVIKQGGESINVNNLRKYLRYYPDIILGNHYGATECTIGSVAHWVNKDSIDDFERNPVVGSPFDNQNVLVLNEQGEIQAVGVPGEICIGGVGVGNGYHKRPELTAKKFIDHPLEPGKKIYRTGDHGRWIHDGTLEFMGRVDNQVKIRGYRVELDEISETLKLHDQIVDAIVRVFDNNGENQLVAYIVFNENLKVSQIQDFLREKLPDYMVPLFYVEIDAIPLTPNGKINKAALPNPLDHNLAANTTIVAPTNELEERLLTIWQKLLPNQEIGIHNNFFELGGHSLLATQLVAIIHQDFEKKIPLREIFFQPTIAELAVLIQKEDQSSFEDIKAIPQQAFYPLSHAQKRLWILSKMQKDLTVYNIPHVVDFSGKMNIEAFELALEKLIGRHEILRTIFIEHNEVPYQKILSPEDFNFKLQVDDLRGFSDRVERATAIAKEERETVFDLATGPLLKARLVLLEDEEQVFLFTLHHVISDGWSNRVFADNIMTMYQAFQQGEENPLEPLEIQYKDYAAWQNNMLENESMLGHRGFWMRQFEGELPVLNLPTDYERPKVMNFAGDAVSLFLEKDITEKLNTYATANNASLFMLLLAATKVLLYRYTGQNDIIIGSPIAGRNHPSLREQIGFYVNTLALRTKFETTWSLTQLVDLIKENLIEAYDHQSYPFDRLVEDLDIERDTGQSPLFNVLVVLQNNESAREELLEMNDLGVGDTELEEGGPTTSKFDITLGFSEGSDGLAIVLQYRTALFAKTSMQQMITHLGKVIQELANDPVQTIDEVSFLSAEEKEEILSFSIAEGIVEPTQTMHGLFKETAEKYPTHLALSDPDSSYTYQELDELTTNIAAYLKEEAKLETEDVVGIVMPKKADFIVAMLATLKAGCTYMPLESNFPIERIKSLARQTDTKFILALEPQIIEELNSSFDCANLDDIRSYKKEDFDPSLVNCQANSLAYIMFTSGSTGRPKGVMVEHRGVIRLVRDTNFFEFGPEHSLLQTGALSFDASTLEIWGPLLNGGRIYLMELTDLLDNQSLKKGILENGVNTIWFTVSWFNQLVESDPSMFANIRSVFVGGEKVSVYHVRKIQEHYPGLEIINGYGPTENTTFSSCLNMVKGDHLLSVGTTISRSEVYILDEHLNLVPKGVRGQIYLGGEGLSRGYINDEERTRKVFIPSPFKEGAKLYKSGDLGYWLDNGEVAFMGRADSQVKIRGYRVEPGEIANVLKNYDGINQAVVIVYTGEKGDKMLAAYYVAEREIKPEELKTFLEGVLPKHMVPSSLLQLDKIPLNKNGKLDRKVLPKPKLIIGKYLAPTNNTELELTEIWSELLGIPSDEISITANFFELGGHSLRATAMAGLIRKRMNKEIFLANIFAYPTIKKLAEILDSLTEELSFERINREAALRSHYPLSPAQKRLFILQQFDENSIAYNIPFDLGLDQFYSQEYIKDAFVALIDRHEILRTSFSFHDGEPVQTIHDKVDFELEIFEGIDIDTARSQFIRPFDLSQAPLLRIGYWLDQQNPTLFIDIHHIATDSISQDIMTKDIQSIVAGIELPSNNLQYRDYVSWLEQEGSQKELKKQEEYWSNVFSEEVPLLEFPTDYPRPEIQSFEGAQATFNLSEEEFNNVRELSKQYGMTAYMTLFSIWTILVSKITNHEDIIIGTPVAGRRHPDLANIVGMFVNTLAIRNYPAKAKSINDFFQEVKGNIVDAFDHQEYPFEKIVESNWDGRIKSRTPIFDTMFGLLERIDDFDPDQHQTEGIQFSDQRNVTKFDLNLRVTDFGHQLNLNLAYCTRLFNRDTIERFVNYFRTIISELAKANHSHSLGTISILSPEEKQKLLQDFNDTQFDYADQQTLVGLFNSAVHDYGQEVAIHSEQEVLTYERLNLKANQIADQILDRQLGHNPLIPICIGREVNMIAGVIGILKAGAACVPIDPDFPSQRIGHILADTSAKLVLCSADVAPLFDKQREVELIIIDDIPFSTALPVILPQVKISTNDLAFVLYTSGSTGKPKGVQIEHASIVNEISFYTKEYNYDSSEKHLMTANFIFDAAIEQMFLPLSNGARLDLISKEILLNPAKLENWLDQHQITFLHSTPALLKTITPRAYTKLKRVCSGGELCTASLAKPWSQYLEFINKYGPTETTINSTFYRFKPNQFVGDALPIGKPLGNTKVYILDDHLNLLPLGAVGELYIGGKGVSRGYLNQDDLNQRSFIESPFVTGERIYRTGDLVKWLPDGNLMFVTRVDDQIKIRGQRLELGEVENVLNHCPEVDHGLVVVQKDQNDQKFLVAYIIPTAEFAKGSVSQFLKDRLPDYMVPKVLVPMNEFPLTATGKIDRRALPIPSLTDIVSEDYVGPRHDVDEELIKIWSNILEFDRIGIQDNFFEIGGHSLIAVKITNQIALRFNQEISLRTFFTNPTIQELADYLLSQEGEVQRSVINRALEQEHYPVSHSQQRLWLLHQMSDQQVSYNIPMVVNLEEELDVDLLEESFARIVERHESLRTVFKLVNGQPRQFILDASDLPTYFHFVDLSNDQNALQKADQLVKEYINGVFDLENGPLFNVYVIKLAKDDYILNINFHHIISDGWSSNIFKREIFECYASALEQRDPELEPLTIQYKDYACWQRQFLSDPANQGHRDFWLQSFAGDLPRLSLPEDFQRPAVKTFNGKAFTYHIDEKTISRIEQLALDHNASLFMVLLAAFKTLFYRYTGMTDIIIGTPTAGREKAELANQIGFYVNTLAIRTQFSANTSFVELLEKVKENVLTVYDHQYYPFDLLLEELALDQDPSHSPLFDIMFVMQNNDEFVLEEDSVAILDANSGSVRKDIDLEGTKLDVSFVARRKAKGLQFYVEFNTDIYKESSLIRVLDHFTNLLASITEENQNDLSTLDILGKEKTLVLSQFNETEVKKDYLPSIQAYFERNVLRNPDYPCIIIADKVLSYAEVNQLANQLAHYFTNEHGLQKGQFVASMLQNSEWQIISFLAILKAGAAYLPIDPSYPFDRIEYIFDQAKPVLNLTLNEEKEDWSVNNLAINSILANLDQYPSDNLEMGDLSEDLAYIIFTSGSTGKPKGVMLEHRGNMNMITDQIAEFGIGSEDRCLQFASISFDASIKEMLIPLYAGASSVLLPTGTKENLAKFQDYILDKNVSLAILPPVYLSNLEREKMRSLRVILTAGEAPKLSDALYYSKYLSYYNAYGPTEFSVCTSVHQVLGYETTIPIGKPIDNTRYYVLDQNLNPLPIGHWGELYVSGPGMARGYLNNPELTEQNFIPNPFVPNTKMYNTGDIGRWLDSGVVEFSGRKDNMVKLRGYRVELGEIESVLLQNSDIDQAVVLYNKEEDYLAAYIVSQQKAENADLLTHAKKQLPGYMIPDYVIQVDEIPLTTNGKRDLNALPKPSLENRNAGVRDPKNTLEKRLLSLWCQLLKKDTITVEDSFFDVGGHSMLAMRLISTIWEEFEINLSIRDLVKFPTIASLALLLEEGLEDQGLLMPLTNQELGENNLYLIPPVLGTSILFYPLAKQLEQQQVNSIGLQYRGFDYDEAFDTSIAAMAESFYQEIIEIHTDKTKPVHLLGYSMGALVAYALVQLLEAQAYQCKLILVDRGIQKGEKKESKTSNQELVDFLLASHIQDLDSSFLPKDLTRIKALLQHNVEIIEDFLVEGQIQADVLAIEAVASTTKNKMKAWKKHVTGEFNLEQTKTDHFRIFDQENLPNILASISEFIQQEEA